MTLEEIQVRYDAERVIERWNTERRIPDDVACMYPEYIRQIDMAIGPGEVENPDDLRRDLMAAMRNGSDR